MKHTAFEIPTSFRVTGVFSAIDYNWDENFVFKGEDHDFWEIVTVLAGEVEVVENAQTYLLRGGEMILHAPGEFHRIKSAGGTSPHVLVFTFSHTGSLPSSLKAGIFKPSDAALEEYRMIFSVLYGYVNVCSATETPPDVHEVIMARHRLEVFLLSLSLSKGSEESVSQNAGAEEYRRLVHTMTERVREPLTLEGLASLHHISPSYIKKLFYAYTGTGPMTYFASLRVKEIQALLQQGYSVSQISRMLGFSSSAYLSTFFKKRTGISPSKYYGDNGGSK